MIKATQLRIGRYGRYTVREDGVIFRLDGKPFKYSLNHKGYQQVSMVINGKSQCLRVHRVIALAFLPNPDSKQTVNHKDFNKINNHVSNLEWATSVEQRVHCIKGGVGVAKNRDNRGARNPMSKITEAEVREIRLIGQSTKLSMPEIGEIFKLSRYTISNIIHKRIWKHVS